MPDEYDESTVRGWDAFAGAIKDRSRDWLKGFKPQPRNYLSEYLAGMQNMSASQASRIYSPPSQFNVNRMAWNPASLACWGFE